MRSSTSRFGDVTFSLDDVFSFPHGLIGLENCRQWILLCDTENAAVGWLQSASQPETAVAVISPRRFLPGYRVRVHRDQLAPLELAADDHAFVLNIVAKNADRLTVNLKAPVIVNLERRLGRQVVTVDDQPVQFELAASRMSLRQSA
jgi:flagellar assembly factor FliW